MEIEYRLLGPTDTTIYRKIRLECLKAYPTHFGSSFEEEQSKSQLAYEIYLEKEDPDNFIFGAFDGKTCVGICAFHREPREKTRHRGELIQMYVASGYQKHGLGKELIARLVNRAFTSLGIEQIVLGVINTNLSAIHVYEKMGFREYGLIPKYFKMGKGYLDQKLMIRERGVFDIDFDG